MVPKESKSYKGDLLNGVRHGRGKYSYDNGDCYEGEWYKDQRYGYGTLRDKEGDIYLGSTHFMHDRLLAVRLDEWMWTPA